MDKKEYNILRKLAENVDSGGKRYGSNYYNGWKKARQTRLGLKPVGPYTWVDGKKPDNITDDGYLIT